MNVLVACEESQEVCKAFRARGHIAFSSDIQECSGGHPEWHIQDDVLKILNPSTFPFGYPKIPSFRTADGKWHDIDRWDLIIAHPPCTYLSNAGACRMYRYINGERYINEKRMHQMKQGKEFFFKFLDADCDQIAVENPTPMKMCELPTPSQVIQPYEYGHPYSKRTLLWLKGLPPLIPTDIIPNHVPWLPSNTSQYAKGRGGSPGSIRGSKNYAKTFSGIAKAMSEQWG